LPNPKSLRSIIPNYLLGIALAVAAGLATQYHCLMNDPVSLALAIALGAGSVFVLGVTLRKLQ